MVDIETFSESAGEEREIGLVAARLEEELQEGEVRPAVEAEFKRFERARIREFVPVFVERRVRADYRGRPPL
jgi:hypothetical protein